jgi:hypothetical protein
MFNVALFKIYNTINNIQNNNHYNNNYNNINVKYDLFFYYTLSIVINYILLEQAFVFIFSFPRTNV